MLCPLKKIKVKKYLYFDHFKCSPSTKVYRFVFEKNKKRFHGGRVFLSTSFPLKHHITKMMKGDVQGGLTVEAAVIVPFFTLMFCMLLHLFSAFALYSPLQNALDTTAASVAQNAYLIQIGEEQWNKVKEKYSIEEKNDWNQLKDGLKSGWVQQQIVSYAGLDKSSAYYIIGDANGIVVTDCDYNIETGLGRIQLEYVIKLPYIPSPFTTFRIGQKTVFRGWVGRNLEGGMYESGKLVYVTEYGEVYHTNRQCSYLTVKVEKVKLENTEDIDKSKNGESSETSKSSRLKEPNKTLTWKKKTYEACHRCKNAQYEEKSYVWVTKTGDCFHKTSKCSALQRVVFLKNKENLDGVRPCSKCVKDND